MHTSHSDNDDPSFLNGCKESPNIHRLHDRTAGILAMIYPYGKIVDVCEMCTCESATQLLAFWQIQQMM